MNNQPQNNGFGGLGIAPRILECLDRLHFTEPTPIQRRSIPLGIEGKDLIAVAQTGTGKTLAFGIPLIQRIAQLKGQGLVVLPTRELAIQVNEDLTAIGKSLGLRTAVLIGGASAHMQRAALGRKPHIIIATPGRLIDHVEQKSISLARVQILILDEADRMFDMGFAPQLKKIFALVPKERQTLLFSATMPPQIVGIAKQHMQIPLQVEIARSGTTSEKIIQEVFFIDRESKTRLLEALLSQYVGSVLVFMRTKHTVKKLVRQIKSMNHTVAEMHSNRSLGQRRDALDGFKSGKYRVLVATDIAARGIHVTGIELVVNYDLPMNSEDYVHRIGRTARAGRTGRAVSFATFDQRRDIKSIERLIRTELSVAKVPALPPRRAEAQEPQSESRGFSPRRQFSRSSARPESRFGNARPHRFQGRSSHGGRKFSRS